MRRLAGCVALAMMLGMQRPCAAGAGTGRPRSNEGRRAPASASRPSSGTLELTALPLQEQLPPSPPPPPPITLILNTDLRRSAYRHREREGEVRLADLVGPRRLCHQTGTFQPQWTSRMWYSRQYELAPMPHAVFFHRGTAFHGTSAVGLLGRPASHGCVRLAPANAADALQAGAQARSTHDQGGRAQRLEGQSTGYRGQGRRQAQDGFQPTGAAPRQRASAATMAAPPPIGPVRASVFA